MKCINSYKETIRQAGSVITLRVAGKMGRWLYTDRRGIDE